MVKTKDRKDSIEEESRKEIEKEFRGDSYR